MSTAFLSETSTDKYFYVGLKFEVTCSACTSRGSADDMMAIVTRCHFWWNNFFFLLLSFSPLFSRITTRLLLTTTYTYIHANATASAQKMRFFFFFFSSFTLFYYFLYDAAIALWVADAAVFQRTTKRQGRKRQREVRWFWPLCLCQQQSIDLLFTVDHYSLLCVVYLSFFPSFFVNYAYIHTYTYSYSFILVTAPCFTNVETHVQKKME